MQAAIFRAVGQPLEVATVDDLVPGENEVVLRVGRCGICGTDLHMTEPGGLAPPTGSVMGHEISGEVVALGRGVTRLKLGTRVAALPIKGCGHCAACRAGESKWCAKGAQYIGGGFADYARAGAHDSLVLPDSLSLADGALVEPLAVALHGVKMVDVRGAHVQVIGAGPIGLGTLFWARKAGAARIDVREGNLERQRMAHDFGADRVEPPMATPPLPQLLLGKVDAPEVVFECVGRPGLLLNAVSQVRPRGTVLSLGACMVTEPFLALSAMRREITIKFPAIYTLKDYQDSIDALESDAVGPRAMLTGTVSLAGLPEQLENLRLPSAHCKVMVDPWLHRDT